MTVLRFYLQGKPLATAFPPCVPPVGETPEPAVPEDPELQGGSP